MLEEGIEEFENELPNLQIMTQWMAPRAIERTIDAYRDLEDAEKIIQWTERLNQVKAQIDAR